MVARETVRLSAPFFWETTSCTIMKSTGTPDFGGKEHRAEISYRYTFRDQEHTGNRVLLKGNNDSNYEKIQRWVLKYPPGSTHACHASEDGAVLEREFPTIGFFIVLPLFFLAIGLGGLYGVWIAGPAPSIDPISKKKSYGKKPGLFFFGVFLLIGLVGFWFIAGQPLLAILKSRNWTETSCKVVASDVRRHPSSKGTTYSIFILYSYEYGGQKYFSDRYDGFTGSSSGTEGKQAIVRQYPPGKQVRCYVNPADPVEALLSREVSTSALFGLIPLVFALVGVFGIRSTLRGKQLATSLGGSSAPRSPKTPFSQPAASTLSGPVTLTAASSPLGRLVAITLISIFWNGIVSVFLYQIFFKGGAGGMAWFMGVVLIPFVIIGAILLLLIPYTFLQLFNPRVSLSLDRYPLAPGQTTRLRWQIRGKAGAVAKLRIKLLGVEEARYRRGTDTATAKETFFDVLVADVANPGLTGSGEITVSLPRDAIPTFTADHNFIRWQFDVQGEIPNRPDIKEEFVCEVRPLNESEIRNYA